jgi:hypothetical protein
VIFLPTSYSPRSQSKESLDALAPLHSFYRGLYTYAGNAQSSWDDHLYLNPNVLLHEVHGSMFTWVFNRKSFCQSILQHQKVHRRFLLLSHPSPSRCVPEKSYLVPPKTQRESGQCPKEQTGPG